MDKQSYKIRFTPRKINSVWSAVNVKKVQTLIQLGKMRLEGMHVFNNRTDAQRNMEFAKEYEEQTKANQTAWLFFTNLSPSYKRDSIWWVMSAKKEETRLRRLGILVALSEEGLKIPILQKTI